jgi:hypothetical protein
MVLFLMFRWIEKAWRTRRSVRGSPDDPPDLSVAPDRRYQSGVGVVGEAVGEEMVLLQLHRGAAFRLNRTGVLIWTLAAKGCTSQEIVRELHPRLAVTTVQLEHDVSALMTQLVRVGLLEGSS